MSDPNPRHPWGNPPWRIDFRPPQAPLPESVDVAIVGGGFSGLSAAAWLRSLSPQTSVAVFEASLIGAGASGRTGGVVLAETAAGNPSGLGDVIAGLSDILRKLQVDCGLQLPGALEVARGGERFDKASGVPVERSPIRWSDSGDLQAVSEVPGGSLDPGKLVSGLGRAADRLGAQIFENCPVGKIDDWAASPELHVPGGKVRAKKVLLAANALSLDLSGLTERAQPRLTLAASSAPLTGEQIAVIGLKDRKPFYTIDLPYLWGRLCADNSIVWGAGLVEPPDSGDLLDIDIAGPEPSRMFALLERRVHGLHPALASVEFTHRWGGPISFRESWQPVFARHPQSAHGIVLGAYAGHGVALSVYFGAWAAEILLGRRDLPPWGHLDTTR